MCCLVQLSVREAKEKQGKGGGLNTPGEILLLAQISKQAEPKGFDLGSWTTTCPSQNSWGMEAFLT